MKQSIIASLFTILLSGTIGHTATQYDLDLAHSAVQFKVDHLMISTVNGRFTDFNGTFEYDAKTNTLAKLEAKINIDSIDTANEKRDAHLKNDDFFGVRDKKGALIKSKQFMTFKISKSEKIKPQTIQKIKGTLSLNGKTLPIILDVNFKGTAKDPWGNERIGFEANATLSRKSFGLTYHKAMETGGVVVGDEIKIEIAGEAIAKK